jgi:hypothetical protein
MVKHNIDCLRKKLIVIIVPIAVLAFALFIPIVYRSEYDRCETDTLADSDSLSASPNKREGCIHVTISQSISYQFIGFGGILYYPVGYTIDDCACFGVRVP